MASHHFLPLVAAACLAEGAGASVVTHRARRAGLLRQTSTAGTPQRKDDGRRPLDSEANQSAPGPVVSDGYWSRAGHSALPGHKAQDSAASAATPKPAPWKKIYTASTDYQVLDTPGAQRRAVDWAMNQMQGDTREIRKMSVVPYDMALGARIMHGLSEKSAATPPPSQDFVDEAFLSQCPMVVVGEQLSIRAPRCGSNMGEWVDSKTRRPVLWWGDGSRGGIRLGVDSAVTGSGSVTFAEFVEKFSSYKYKFGLHNCLDSLRYFVEEEIIKMDHMAPRASSTAEDHDMLMSTEAYFFKYSIRHPNGTAVVETKLFRLDQDEVTFNLKTDGLSDPVPIAIARRQGKWRRGQWRECTRALRGWMVDFPQAPTEEFLVTLKDLRVATAAVLTLMAVRDEAVNASGFPTMGRGWLQWLVWRTIIWIIVGLVLAAVFLYCLIARGVDQKLKRWLFKLENVALPKYPLTQRAANFHATY